MFQLKDKFIAGIYSSNSKIILLLFCIFCGVEFFIDPLGNFPLNDDWWYTKTLYTWCNESVLDATGWGYAAKLPQLFIAKLFVSIFGFSFTVLRFSTLTLSFLGLLFFYLLLENFIIKNRISAFLISLLLLFNPLYLSLSNSFMTDVPFISFLIIGLYFYFRYKHKQASGAFVISLLFLTAAVLSRQLGLAFVSGILLSEIIFSKKIKLSSVIFVVIPALCLFIFEYWMHSKNINSGYTYAFFRTEEWSDLNSFTAPLINFSKRWVYYISLSGLVLSPVLIPYLFNNFKNKKHLADKKLFVVSAILFIPVILSFKNFPIGNYLYDSGVGPETYVDTYILRINLNHASSCFIFNFIKLLSFLGSFGLILIVGNSVKVLWLSRKENTALNHKLLVIYISLLFYYFFLSQAWAIFDRYILVFSIFIIPVIFLSNPKLHLQSRMFKVLLTLLVIFSTFAAKDYLNNNRTKWTVIEYLQKCKTDNKNINAGYEHAGYYFSNSKDWYAKWQNKFSDEYLVTQGPLKDYKIINWISYQRYIPYKRDTIFILRHSKKIPL